MALGRSIAVQSLEGNIALFGSVFQQGRLVEARRQSKDDAERHGGMLLQLVPAHRCYFAEMTIPRDPGNRLSDLLYNEFLDRLPFLPEGLSFQFWPNRNGGENPALLSGWGIAVPGQVGARHEHQKTYPVCSGLLIVEALTRHVRDRGGVHFGIQTGEDFVGVWKVDATGLAGHRTLRSGNLAELKDELPSTLSFIAGEANPTAVWLFHDVAPRGELRATIREALSAASLPAAREWPRSWPYLANWGELALGPMGGMPVAFHWRSLVAPRDLRRWGLALTAVFVLGGALSSLRTARMVDEIRGIQRMSRELTQQVAPGLPAGDDPLKTVRAELFRLEEVLASRREESVLSRPLDILAALGAVIRNHPSAEITTTEFRGDSLVVLGKANSFKAIDLLRADLEKKPDFGVVQLASAEKEPDSERINFQYVIKSAGESQ